MKDGESRQVVTGVLERECFRLSLFLSISVAHFEGGFHGVICLGRTLSLFLSQEGISCTLNPRVDVDLFNSGSGIILDTFIRFNA